MAEDNSKPPKASFDPGWNDPPMFSYSAAPPSASGKTRLNLNKRVAFPLQGGNVALSNQPTDSAGLPLPMSGSVPLPSGFSMPPMSNHETGMPPPLPTSSKPTVTLNPIPHLPSTTLPIDPNVNPEDRRKLIMTSIQSHLASISSTNDVSEMSKRLDIMKQNLLDNKLNSAIEDILLKITKALEDKNILEATSLHRILVVDYLNTCSQWAPALRQLILLLEPQQVFENSSSALLAQSNEVPMISAEGLDGECDTINKNKNFSKIYHI